MLNVSLVNLLKCGGKFDLYESGHLYHSFIPIQLLCCHAAYCDIQYEEQCVNLMCPVQNVLSVSQ